MIIEEIWKDILGYEGLYQVSNLGRVKSFPRPGNWKERILNPIINKGYLHVGLRKDGKEKRFRVHRLVVEAFLGKIPDGFVVNHINEIKSDNRLENLEIVTQKENVNHGTGIARSVVARKGFKHSEESKKKISDARKGKKFAPLSNEHKAKISKALKGRTFSEGHKRKLSEAQKGKTYSTEAKQKMSDARKAYYQRQRED